MVDAPKLDPTSELDAASDLVAQNNSSMETDKPQDSPSESDAMKTPTVEPSEQRDIGSNTEVLTESQAEHLAASTVAASLEPDRSVIRLLEKAENSSGKLVNILVKYFPSFCDDARFNGQKVRFYKRAQIFVADLWAAFNGSSYGQFDDIAHLTMFAGQ